MRCGNCGNNTKKEAVVSRYDLTTWAGLPAAAARMRTFRCSSCGDRSVAGKDLEAALAGLLRTIVRLPRRLTGAEARFLRGHLRLTQKQLADRMGINSITISDWERGDRPISPEHDFILRAFSSEQLPRDAPLQVHKALPPKRAHALVVAEFLEQATPKRRARSAR